MKYELMEKQRAFLEVDHENELDVAMYQGGYGSGKTWCGSFLGINLARKYAGCRGLVCAKTYKLLKNTTLDEYFKHFERIGYRKGIHYKYNKVDQKITFSNGSEILFMDVDDPEKIKSLNLHWAEIEEASQISESSFKQILGRLRNTYRRPNWPDFHYRLFAHTNPQATKGWIHKYFVEKKKPNYRLIIAPTSDNIYLPKHFIEELKDAYDPEYYRINVLGEFGDYNSGLVVKGFSDNNVKKLKYNDKLDLHLTCDFNVDPMCWYVAHKDEENVYYIDEIVIENTTTQQSIDEFIRRYPNHKGNIIVNGDASGDNRSCTSEYTNYVIIKRALEKAGYKPKFELRDYNPPILNRIYAFNAKVKNAKGEVHIFVDNKCKWLIYNMYNLKFKEGTTIVDVPTHAQIKKDRDSKFLEHPFDAVSYLVERYWRIK